MKLRSGIHILSSGSCPLDPLHMSPCFHPERVNLLDACDTIIQTPHSRTGVQSAAPQIECKLAEDVAAVPAA